MLKPATIAVLKALVEIIKQETSDWSARMGALWLLYAKYGNQMDYQIQRGIQMKSPSEVLKKFIEVLDNALIEDEHVAGDAFTYLLNPRAQPYEQFSMQDVALTLNSLPSDPQLN